MGTLLLGHTGNLGSKLADYLCSIHACSGDERSMSFFYAAIAKVVLLRHLRESMSHGKRLDSGSFSW